MTSQKIRQIFESVKGKIITIEGIDKVGKTTQCGLLLEHFMKYNVPFVFYSFPDYMTESGKKIRDYLFNRDHGAVSKYEFELLQFYNKIEKKDIIKKYLNWGYYVLCNRYIESQYVYGQLEGHNLETLMAMNQELPQSDIVFILDLPVDSIESRLGERVKKHGKEAIDKYEENSEFLRNAREKYLDLAQRFDNWIVIDCKNKSMLQINREIVKKSVLVLKVIQQNE